MWNAFMFFCFYVYEVVRSNFRVAYDIITPFHTMKPGIVSVDLEPDLTPLQLMVLANVMSMTPGTLSLDISKNRRRIYIHVMFLDDPESFRTFIKKQYEGRIKRVF